MGTTNSSYLLKHIHNKWCKKKKLGDPEQDTADIALFLQTWSTKVSVASPWTNTGPNVGMGLEPDGLSSSQDLMKTVSVFLFSE